MRVISNEELQDILENHRAWFTEVSDGERADLSNVDLHGVDLFNVNLQYADLHGADLSGAKLQNAELQNANLQGANLQGAFLYRAQLQNANLRDASLYKANLHSAELQESNLRGTYLGCADLWKANLYRADLQNADLLQTKMYNTYMKEVDRPWLVIVDHIGSRKADTIYLADIDNVWCGCWNEYSGGTLAEFKIRVDKFYPADSENEECQRYRIEYLSAIKMFKSIREAYLKKCNGGGKSSEKNIK